MDHLNSNEGLLEEFQSAYKSDHSTETALVKVQNDILKTIDNNMNVVPRSTKNTNDETEN